MMIPIMLMVGMMRKTTIMTATKLNVDFFEHEHQSLQTSIGNILFSASRKFRTFCTFSIFSCTSTELPSHKTPQRES